MPAAIKTQPGLFDREVSNPELEEMIDKMLELEDAAKEYRDARKPVKEAIELLQLKEGERVRIGRFVIEGKARNGGGFEVPAWERVTVGKISEIDS